MRARRPTTKAERQSIYKRRRLRARTPDEVALFVEMIRQQGIAFRIRAAKLEDAYLHDAERQRLDAEKVRFPGTPSPDVATDASLSQRIAARTAQTLKQPGES